MEGALCGSEPGLRLIETLLWDGSQMPRLPRHLARLERSATRLAWSCDPDAARAALLAAAPRDLARMRLTLDAGGQLEVTATALTAPQPLWRLGLANRRLSSGDPWLRVKSTRRPVHDPVRAAIPADLDEMIFINERNEVCEGTITNIFFDLGDGLCTPPLLSGLLPGILREELLESGQCREALFPHTDLGRARLWVGNSLRGLVPAVFGLAMPMS